MMESQQDEETTPPLTRLEEMDGNGAYLRVILMSAVIFVSAVIALSLVLFLGLLIPLLIQLKNGSFHQNTTGRRRQRRQKEPQYSPYNLYLVYLALIDLAWFVPMMAMEIMTLNQKFNPRFYSSSVYILMDDPLPAFEYGGGTAGVSPPIGMFLSVAYVFANMWINAIIAYEVFVLLQATKRAQRINQPSLRRVNLQAGGVLFGSMLYGAFYYYSYAYGWFGIFWVLFGSVMSHVPFVYVIGVFILVKWRGLMPALNNGSTPRDRAVRGLTLYFLRIVFVFIGVWLPAIVTAQLLADAGTSVEEFFNAVTGKTEEAYAKIYLVLFIGTLLMFIQPVITFCMVLTKDDVKKYIKDLVTLKYIFGDCSNCCRRDKALPVVANDTTIEGAPATPSSVTILGYNFPDVDADDDVDAHDDNDDDDDTDDDTGDSNDNGTYVENGILKYKSRTPRESAVAVLATGEVVSLQAQDAAEIAPPNRE